jgi:hypothetical protein
MFKSRKVRPFHLLVKSSVMDQDHDLFDRVQARRSGTGSGVVSYATEIYLSVKFFVWDSKMNIIKKYVC